MMVSNPMYEKGINKLHSHVHNSQSEMHLMLSPQEATRSPLGGGANHKKIELTMPIAKRARMQQQPPHHNCGSG